MPTESLMEKEEKIDYSPVLSKKWCFGNSIRFWNPVSRRQDIFANSRRQIFEKVGLLKLIESIDLNSNLVQIVISFFNF